MKYFAKHITRSLSIAAIAALSIPMFTGCNDDSVVGNSLVQEEIFVVVDSTFRISAHPVRTDSVISRTISQMIGCVNAPGYGLLSSNVVTQFMPAIQLDTTGVKAEYVDSLKLQFVFESDAYTGDTIAPMGIEVYPLVKSLDTPIYSNFDPTGYYDPNQLYGSTVYNLAWDYLPTVVGTSTTTRTLDIMLPVTLARDLFKAYKADPENFGSPTYFTENIFKGLFIKSSYGSGRVINISKTLLNMYYHSIQSIENDDGEMVDSTITSVGSFFAVTPEVISNNSMQLNMDQSIYDAVAAGENIILAPAGYDVELTFPAREIIESYRNSVTGLGVINTLSMNIAADVIDNEYSIAPPPTLLLILKKDKDDFFLNNELPDDKTSFYADYNSTIGGYSFSGLRDYIVDLMEKDTITDEDVTFVLTPVYVATETSSSSYYYYYTTTYLTSVTPFVSWPAMTKINTEKTKIWFTYTKQDIKK